MSQPPDLQPLAADLYQQLAPIAEGDEAYGWPLAHWCAAMWAPVEQVAGIFNDQPDGTPGWATALQSDTSPYEWLGYLGQRLGVILPVGTPDVEARRMIAETRGIHRGGIPAMLADIKATLTDTKFVVIVERDTGPHHITFYTRASETPDSAATLAAALAPDRKRVGLLIAHELYRGQSWRDAQIADPVTTWAQLDAIRADTTWLTAQTDDIEV